MRANQLMSKEVVCLRPIESVEAIMSILRDYDHNCFPVVEDRDQRVLLGVVYRYVFTAVFPGLRPQEVKELPRVIVKGIRVKDVDYDFFHGQAWCRAQCEVAVGPLDLKDTCSFAFVEDIA